MNLALEFGSNPVGIPEGDIINFPSKALQAQDLSGSYPAESFRQQDPTNHQSPYRREDFPGTPKLSSHWP